MKQKKKSKNLWSLMLILSMAMAMMIGMSLTANADVTNYDVWVGNTQVTSENMDNVLGDGTVSYIPATTGENPTPATLTLNGANITTQHVENGTKYGIYYKENLNIVLAESSVNTIASEGLEQGIGNLYNFNLDISGSGSLTVTAVYRGIYSVGNFSFSGDGSLTVTAAPDNGYAIWGDKGITINGGTVEAIGKYGINTKNSADTTINNGNVTAFGSMENGSYGVGIYTQNLMINGGSLTASGDYKGIYARYNVEITNDVDSVIAYSNGQAMYGTVKNAIPGTGWTDTKGTQGKTDYAVNTKGQTIPNTIKKVEFYPGPEDIAAKLINAIPDNPTTEEGAAAVKAAREAFDALTDTQKDRIKLSQLKKLRKAEEAIESQKAIANVSELVYVLDDDPTKADPDKAQAAYSAYMALTDDQKELLEKAVKDKVAVYKAFYETQYANQKAADEVSAMLTELPYDPAKADLTEAKAVYKAYTDLKDEQKALLGKDAQQKAAAYGEFFGPAYTAIGMVKALPDDPADAEETAAQAAYGAYMLLSDAQKALFDTDTQKKVEAYGVYYINKYAAKTVNDLVSVLPDDPADAEETAAQAAYGAYMLLSDEQKALLDEDVQKKVTAYGDYYKTQYANQAAAAKVSAMVNNLPYYPSKAKKSEAKAAFGAYMALTKAQKALLGKEVQQKVAAYKYFYEAKYAKAQKTKLKSVETKKGKKAVVKWEAVSGVSGYQICYKAKGKKAQKVNVNSAKAAKKTIKKLKANKKYTFKVRTFTKVYNPKTGKNQNIYGKWSNQKKAKAWRK